MRWWTRTAVAGGLGAAGLVGAGALGVRALRRPAPLTGQVAIVTGGSRGLGLLIARELADQGCRLAICARDRDELRRAAEDLCRRGTEVVTVVCDVARRDQAELLVARTVDRFGRVDVVVNNAGIIQVGPVESATVEDFEAALGVMFWGTVYPTLAALPHMRARRYGRIVNITSIGGKLSAPHLLPYSCAKFAAVGFSEGLRAELAPAGVSVTTVVPGLMRTGSHLHAIFTGRRRYEFAWFSVAASLPGLSMDAQRAARRIVDAARRGKPELILTPVAQAAARFSGALPGVTSRLLGVTDRLLPSAGDADTGRAEGLAAQEELDSALFRWATALNLAAARRLNQLPAPAAPAGSGA
jgi:NAD(P)-dependent dehydrogenase (short-subunit alcohol dehydrogenase family)